MNAMLARLQRENEQLRHMVIQRDRELASIRQAPGSSDGARLQAAEHEGVEGGGDDEVSRTTSRSELSEPGPSSEEDSPTTKEPAGINDPAVVEEVLEQDIPKANEKTDAESKKED